MFRDFLCFRARRILIMPLSFSSQQDKTHDSLPSYKNESNNVFPNDTNMGHIYYSSNENIIGISQNESKGNATFENKTILFHKQTYNTSNESVNSNESVQSSEITHKEKEYPLTNTAQLIDFEQVTKDTYDNNQIENSHPNKDNNKDETFEHTHDLHNKIPVTENVDELHKFCEITQSKNGMAAPLDFKLTNKSAVFVSILVSLARKRLK